MRSLRQSAAAILVIGGMAGSGIGLMAQPAGASTRPAPTAVKLAVSAATRLDFRKVYAAFRHLPVSDVARIRPISVYSARVTRTGADWAVISVQPSLKAPMNVRIGLQDGGASALLTRSSGQAWKMAGLGRGPLSCDTRIPSSVRGLWKLGRCPAAASRPSRTGPPAAGPLSIPSEIATIATSEDGVSDTPASTNFNFDCNPFTALENPSAPDSGCGTDPKFGIQNHSEQWCSDFAKYVWKAAGITTDIATITPLSSTFYTWGLQQGESMPVDGTNAAVGDAMVLYPAGDTQTTTELEKDGAHVGIVTAVNSNGTINVVNGDFTSGDNIKVVEYDNVSPGPWASNVEDAAGEQWVFVAPPGSSGGSGGNLWLRDASGSQVNTTAGMMAGTSPAITALSGGGYEVAFQGNTGTLWLRNSSGSQVNTTAGMMAGTSPAITALSGGGYEVAFQSIGGSLWLRDSSGSQANTTAGMDPGSSPAIAGLEGGGFEVAFQSNAHQLWLRDSSGSQASTTAGMASGTSPSIAAMSGGGYEVAFQSNAHQLWLRNSSGSQANTTAGMDSGSSPAIAGLWGGGYEVAFQSNAHQLWLRDYFGSQANTTAGMDPGTSPAIAGVEGGGFEVGFQSNAHQLWLRDSSGSQANTTAGMGSGTSPAIAGLSAGGYEATFQDNT